jgi:FkbM family methyltransferase
VTRQGLGARLRAFTNPPVPSSSRPVASTPTDPETQAIRASLDDPVLGPELRALLSVGSRREARDRHAMSVLLAGTLRRDAHTIDVGAHSGAVLREVLRVAPEGVHLAYEPIPALSQWLAEEFPSVSVRNAALSDENGTATFVHVLSAPEYSGLREREYPGLDDVVKQELIVRTERLDDAIPDELRPALIKIDVEGAEMLVLRGAEQTIRRFRPTIIFEHGVGASDRYGTRSSELYELLVDDLGMRIFDLDGTGPYTRDQFDAVFSEPIWNFVAVA